MVIHVWHEVRYSDPFLMPADYVALPSTRRGNLARSGSLDAHVDPEHGARREVLYRPRILSIRVDQG